MSVGSSTSDLHQDAASAAVKRLSLIGRYSSSDNPQIPDPRDEVETRWKKIEKDFEDMIQARMRKAEEIKALVNQCKVGVLFSFFKKKKKNLFKFKLLLQTLVIIIFFMNCISTLKIKLIFYSHGPVSSNLLVSL